MTLRRRTLLTLTATALTASAVGTTFALNPDVLGTASAAMPSPATTAYRPELPKPTGRYSIGTTELHLVDRARKDPWSGSGKPRELMASVWYPAVPGSGARTPYVPAKIAGLLGAELTEPLGLKPEQLDYAGASTHARAGVPALGRHPVVVYSPGFGTSRLMGTQLVEDLVSRGYVVVTMDHTGEAPVLFPGGRVAPAVVRVEELKKATSVRVADTRYVLDQLRKLASGGNPDAGHRKLPNGLRGSLDLRHTGMLGYSLGGLTAAETMLRDRRVDAGVNMDGTLQYGFPAGELIESAKRGLDRPFLLFGGQTHTHLSQPGAPMNDVSWTTFWNNQRGWKLDLNLPGGTHASFADYQFSAPGLARHAGLPDEVVEGLLGTVDPVRSVAAQRAYLGAYFDRFLKGRPQPLLWKESPRHPDVKFVR
ncbi:alpha/beta hydrolase family protein [Kribbella italica]|uniref:Putative dienelactone hydrolase n=1 Tax=Kribbella italica TaxID=1540520 RepID=A0A7W9MXL6_9ACTN|nr:lipase [Kribbella italica]MBB5839894.1 putative dienelactone hydrolase [Kribbella italica]